MEIIEINDAFGNPTGFTTPTMSEIDKCFCAIDFYIWFYYTSSNKERQLHKLLISLSHNFYSSKLSA